MGALSEKEKENALNEVRILASLAYCFHFHLIIWIYSHPNIVGYKEAFFEDSSSSLCLVMDFANDGDLY